MNKYNISSKNDLTLKVTINRHINSALSHYSDYQLLNLSSKVILNSDLSGVVKDLQENFIGHGETKGFRFSKICDTYKGYLYEIQKGGTKYYEVFKRRVNARYGVVKYPNSKAFGMWAWTYFSFEKARKKFEEINKD